jgi:hypothetical protein
MLPWRLGISGPPRIKESGMHTSSTPVVSSLSNPLPSSAIFQKPLLTVLGTRTELDPSRGVPTTEAIEAVLVMTGIDKDHLPAGWVRWDPRGPGIYNRVMWAAKLFREKKKWMWSPHRGLWALTETGVEAARPLCQLKKPKRPEGNVTAQWFAQHLTPQRGQNKSPLMSQMEAALRRHLPISYRADLIEDHINTYIMRAIRRDAFAKHLQEGKLTYGKVVSYCVNSGRTDARNMGTDPLCRELYGARTERERRGDVVLVDEQANLHGMGRDGTFVDEESLVAPNPEVEFEDVWARIQTLVHERMPKAGDRYTHILAMRARGLSLDEIAQAEGVSRNRAAAMLAGVRRCLREGEGAESLKI